MKAGRAPTRSGSATRGRAFVRACALLVAGVVAAAAPSSFAQTTATALAGLGSASIDNRRAAADAIESLDSTGSDATEAIAQQLTDVRRSGGERVMSVMSELRPRGGDGKSTAKPESGPHDADVVELLVQRKPDTAVVNALATVCLMRALARVGTTPAIRQLVPMAIDEGEAFRPELWRELKQLDERATAALIEARGDPSFEIRAWAKDTLEALGKRTPGDTVQTTNDQVLVDVLRAYASIRDIDALPVVLSFVNSERTPVRTAAREATLAYGQDAAGKLRTTYTALTGERIPDDAEAAQVAHQLFNAYDRHRLRDVYARLDEGLAKQHAGDTDGAIADFDDVLARQPVLERGAEIAPAYVAYAEAIEGTDRPRALDYLHRALRLDDISRAATPTVRKDDAGGAESNHVRSEILYLEGEDRMSRGLTDTIPFQEALSLDPANAHARARLDGLLAEGTARRTREGHVAMAIGATGMSFVAAGLLGLRAPRRRRDSMGKARR